MRRKAAIALMLALVLFLLLPSLPLRLSAKVFFMAATTTNWSGHVAATESMSELLLTTEAIRPV